MGLRDQKTVEDEILSLTVFVQIACTEVERAGRLMNERMVSAREGVVGGCPLG